MGLFIIVLRGIVFINHFSFFQKEVPGFFYFIGCTPPDRDAKKVPTNHSPRFYVDEASLKLGTETLAALALDWLSSNGKR